MQTSNNVHAGGVQGFCKGKAIHWKWTYLRNYQVSSKNFVPEEGTRVKYMGDSLWMTGNIRVVNKKYPRGNLFLFQSQATNIQTLFRKTNLKMDSWNNNSYGRFY